MNKHYFFSVFIVIISCSVFMELTTSCSKGTKTEDTEQAKIDSLTKLCQEQRNHVNELENFVFSLSQTMDSIDVQEKGLLAEGNLEKRMKQGKESLLINLKRYKETIERQREQIKNLEDRLTAKNDEMSAKMLQIVSFYKKQLEEKEKTIASLQNTIKQNKSDIIQLQTSVSNLLSKSEKQEATIQEQKNTLTRQTNMINTCYVKIGTKKELKSAGLISSGLLKKTKVDNAQLNPDKFESMDMRKCNDIKINSSNPKVLTQMPSSSYSIIKNEDGTSYLHINDPNKFWSVSRYLIIQL